MSRKTNPTKMAAKRKLRAYGSDSAPVEVREAVPLTEEEKRLRRADAMTIMAMIVGVASSLRK